MSGAKRIWQFINNVGANCIFASRELLHLCSRSTIDNTFSRLVKQGKLERLAAGIFIVAGGSGESPPVQAIVAVKARAFSKRAHANTTGNPEKTEKEKQEVFLTDGCKGSFRTVHGRVFWKHAGPARLASAASLASQEQESTGSIDSVIILEEPCKTETEPSNITLALLFFANKLDQVLAELNSSEKSRSFNYSQGMRAQFGVTRVILKVVTRNHTRGATRRPIKKSARGPTPSPIAMTL